MHDFDKILILDFGSQYTQLIARRIREKHVYCEIQPYDCPIDQIRSFNPKGIILSGGPASTLAADAPMIGDEVFTLNVPVLGVCYGMQLISKKFGGVVKSSESREYGSAQMVIEQHGKLLATLPPQSRVWMSHGDSIEKAPPGYEVLARSSKGVMAAFAHFSKNIFGVQFHPEVAHTEFGSQILTNFLVDICKCLPNWTMSSFIEDALQQVRAKVGADRVVCGLSGGVDSSVVAVILHKAIGDRLTCIFINNGLLRLGEAEKVQKIFRDHFKIDLRYVDASERFLSRLEGVVEPEAKRKTIGYEFIKVFEEEAAKLKQVKFLAQGTLYPDVIESVSFKGPSAVIKSHHNVGGLPEKMGLKLVEPLRELFKDEVRRLGEELGMPAEIIYRQPFPGPGLAIRILGDVTRERLQILRQADQIVLEEMKRANLYYQVWQSFAVLLPIKTVGVMGDERTYEHVIALRVVESQDGMTAHWVALPADLLGHISNRIINEVCGVNRVVYDISSKPPATIEWE